MSVENWIRTQPEGQFLDRKGCYDYSTGKPKRRRAKDVAWDIAETLAAMANADGGMVIVGVEDDGKPTGVDYPDDRLEILRRAPRTHVRPPLRAHVRPDMLKGKPVLLFEVDWSPDVHQLTDGR